MPAKMARPASTRGNYNVAAPHILRGDPSAPPLISIGHIVALTLRNVVISGLSQAGADKRGAPVRDRPCANIPQSFDGPPDRGHADSAGPRQRPPRRRLNAYFLLVGGRLGNRVISLIREIRLQTRIRHSYAFALGVIAVTFRCVGKLGGPRHVRYMFPRLLLLPLGAILSVQNPRHSFRDGALNMQEAQPAGRRQGRPSVNRFANCNRFLGRSIFCKLNSVEATAELCLVSVTFLLSKFSRAGVLFGHVSQYIIISITYACQNSHLARPAWQVLSYGFGQSSNHVSCHQYLFPSRNFRIFISSEARRTDLHDTFAARAAVSSSDVKAPEGS